MKEQLLSNKIFFNLKGGLNNFIFQMYSAPQLSMDHQKEQEKWERDERKLK